jgi:hypothetical protein
MRLFAVPLLLFVAGSAKICSSEDKGGADASAQASGSASVKDSAAASMRAKGALALPRIGGSVASAGDFSVELATHQNGLVEALISDAKGALVSAGVKLSALVRAKGGATEKLELAFVPARARFEGRAKAGVELVPGPIDVDLDVGGKVQTCKLNAAVVLPEPRFGGNVLAAGAYSAELFVSPKGEVRAFIDNAGAQVKGDAAAKFKVNANARGGAREEINLAFDPPHACFIGKAKAGVELAPGPLEFVADASVGGGVGRLENVGLSVDASHGGEVVAVGDFSVELVAKGPEIRAFVFDASGKAHAAADLDLNLDVGAGAGTRLKLEWDAPSLSYVAKANANVNLALEPIRVSLVASGKAFVGAVASLKAAAKANANFKAKADVDVDTNAKLDADANAKLAAGAKAKLDANANAAKNASASIKVTPPKVNVTTSKSASAGTKAGGGAKASAGFSIGVK